MTSTVTNNTSSSSAASAAAAAASTLASGTTSAASQSQSFLQLLVAQLNNQDPMDPMDNAQMTSQIAEINTVSGIQQLNTTVSSMATQFASMQMAQGASLIGQQVAASGNTMTMSTSSGTTTGTGAFSLSSAATGVTVKVQSPSGQTLDTLQLGAMAAGNQTFTWPNASSYTGTGSPTFTVTATAGGTAVTATPLIVDTVGSVGTNASGAVTVNLSSSGTSVPLTSVQQIY